MGCLARVALLVLLLPQLAAAGGATSPLTIRLDGKILRKGSGKLVFSLSAFELDGAKELLLANRKTGEKRVVALSSVYADSSYSDTMDAETLGAIDAEDWAPFVVWTLPDNVDLLSARLNAIHEYQNALRLELGRALLEDEGGSKVSSRVSLNKLEKFNRIGAVIARAILEKGAGPEPENLFRYPIRIQSSFNPFSSRPAGYSTSPLAQIREVLFWDVHRTLTQQMGVDENLVDLVFDSPNTVRAFTLAGESTRDEQLDFAPTVVISPEAIDAAMYIARQGIAPQIRELVRAKSFRDDFIDDRPVVDAFVNNGKVVAVAGRRLAVSFVPPFMKPGETVAASLGEGGGEDLPVVLETPMTEEGYTLTAELPDAAIARVRPGMVVRRR